jgi:hypothetical protein
MNHTQFQEYMRTLPTLGLVRFVEELQPGAYSSGKLYDAWVESSLCDDHFRNDRAIFRYALRKTDNITLASKVRFVKYPNVR